MIKQKIPMVEKRESSNKLFNFRPIFFSAVFFIFGIVFSCVLIKYALPGWTLCFLLPLAGLPFCFVTTKREVQQRIFAVSLTTLFFFLGMLSFFLQTQSFQKARPYQGAYAVQGKVTDSVQADGISWLELSDIRIDGTKEKGNLIAYLPTDYAVNVALSDMVTLYGVVSTEVALFDEGGFRSYAVDRKVKYEMRVENIVVNGHTLDIFLDLKQRLRDWVDKGMDEAPSEVFLALMLGETSGMDRTLLKNVRYGGIAHVFAVSGLHVGALFGCLAFLMKCKPFYQIPKPIRFCIVGAILLFYGGVCGFSSSVVRAMLTCLCFYGAVLMGIELDTLETIALACIMTTLLSPCAVFTAGYQLSFTACVGIAFLKRRFEKGIWWVWGKIRAWVGRPVKTYLPNEHSHPLTILQTIERNSIQFLSVTLSAQIFTLPIQAITFGYISVWSLPLNCVFVPLIGVAFPLFLFLAVIALCFPIGISWIILHIPNLFLTLFTLLFSVLDFTAVAVTGLRFGLFTVLCYYFALLLCTDKWNMPGRYKYPLVILLVMGFVVSLCIPAV